MADSSRRGFLPCYRTALASECLHLGDFQVVALTPLSNNVWRGLEGNHRARQRKANPVAGYRARGLEGSLAKHTPQPVELPPEATRGRFEFEASSRIASARGRFLASRTSQLPCQRLLAFSPGSGWHSTQVRSALAVAQ